MQLTSRYLVDNRTNIILDMAGFVTEYRPVYNRQLKVYKGIDNVLEFRALNADQKPVDIDTYTPKFVAFDENKMMVIEHDGVILQTSDSAGAFTNKGLFSVTISENDLLNIKEQFLSYNIYLVDADDNRVLTYTDTHFDNDATIHVSSKAFPGPKESLSVTTFTEDNGAWYSEAIDAQPGINGNEALHTAATYVDGYSGDLVVQATLDNQITSTTNWADIDTVTFSGSEVQPVPVNFNGVFMFLRFKATSSPSTITKILVRN